MPDILTNFVNDNISLSDLINGYEILSTGENEQAVLTDFSIALPDNVKAQILVDDVPIYTIAGKTRLQGKEIIDSEKTVTLKLSPEEAILWNRVTGYYGAQKYSYMLKPQFLNQAGSIAPFNTSVETVTNTGSIVADWAIASDGDMFCHNVSSAVFAKVAGGGTGTMTNLLTNIYGAAYDGERYFYIHQNSQIFKYDIETETQIYSWSGHQSLNASTGAWSNYCDGCIAYSHAYNVAPFLVDLVNQTTFQCAGMPTDSGGNKANMGVFRDSYGRWVVLRAINNGISWWRSGSSAFNGVGATYGTLATNSVPFVPYGANRTLHQSTKPNIAVIFNSNNTDLYMIDVDTMTVLPKRSLTGFQSGMVLKLSHDPVGADNDLGPIPLSVSGIRVLPN